MSGDRRWYRPCSLEGCHGENSDQRCRVPHHHHFFRGHLDTQACDCDEGGQPGTKVGG